MTATIYLHADNSPIEVDSYANSCRVDLMGVPHLWHAASELEAIGSAIAELRTALRLLLDREGQVELKNAEAPAGVATAEEVPPLVAGRSRVINEPLGGPKHPNKEAPAGVATAGQRQSDSTPKSTTNEGDDTRWT